MASEKQSANAAVRAPFQPPAEKFEHEYDNAKDASREKAFKTIFRGKAIVQPAKPFYLNLRFQDLRSSSKPPSKDHGNVSRAPWVGRSTFQKGESSHQNLRKTQRNFGQEKFFFKNQLQGLKKGGGVGFQSKRRAISRMRGRSTFKDTNKQPIFDICEGTPPDHLLDIHKVSTTNDPKISSSRAPFNPTKTAQVWRKKILDPKEAFINHVHPARITLPSHMLQNSIGLLRQSALIGKFSDPSMSFSDIKSWAFSSYWFGLKDIFLADMDSKFFIAIFDSKEYRDIVHKQKSWFCKGSGLYTMIWIPNFNLQETIVPFFPCWVSFPLLPLEYREPVIVEILANKLGIFLRHDLIPFDSPQLEVRVCLLVDKRKPLSTSLMITSQWGDWIQPVKIQDEATVSKFQHKLGHFSTQCRTGNQNITVICPDHCSDPDSCSRKFCLRDSAAQMPSNQCLKDSVAQMPYIPGDNQLPTSSSSSRQVTELQFLHILRWIMFFWQQLSLQTTRPLLSNSNSFITRVPTSNFLIWDAMGFLSNLLTHDQSSKITRD